MGVSTVAAHFLLFIVTVTLVMMIVDTITNYVTEMDTALNQKVESMNKKIRTDISIITIDYDSVNTYLVVYVENTGSEIIDQNKTDLYVDGERLNRNLVNKTVEPDTDNINPGMFDPAEILKMNVTKALSPGSHNIIVSTDNGVKAEETFSV